MSGLASQADPQYVEILEGRSCFNDDSDFAAHLLSLKMARLERRVTNFPFGFSVRFNEIA